MCKFTRTKEAKNKSKRRYGGWHGALFVSYFQNRFETETLLTSHSEVDQAQQRPTKPSKPSSEVDQDQQIWAWSISSPASAKPDSAKPESPTQDKALNPTFTSGHTRRYCAEPYWVIESLRRPIPPTTRLNPNWILDVIGKGKIIGSKKIFRNQAQHLMRSIWDSRVLSQVIVEAHSAVEKRFIKCHPSSSAFRPPPLESVSMRGTLFISIFIDISSN